MSHPWRYERATVPAVRHYVERELLSRFEQGWLLLAERRTRGTEAMPSTVTFVFRRAAPLRRRSRRSAAAARSKRGGRGSTRLRAVSRVQL